MKRRRCALAALAVASLADAIERMDIGPLLDRVVDRLERWREEIALREMARAPAAPPARACSCTDPDIQCGVCAPWGHA